ncbi:hypothetical protein HWV62_41180 [Athelia sp. TMB]|nr:hypothetical protein HWV62_41180 [Athelia sp. TMB]
MSTTPSHNSPEKLEIPIPDKPPTYQVETTGSRWKDLWVAFTARRTEEKKKVEKIMEALPKRFVKKKNPDGADASPAADAAAP